MRNRLRISALLVAGALAASAPVAAGAPPHPGGWSASSGDGGRPPRALHPEHSSGDEPQWLAPPLAPGRRTTASSDPVRWRVAPGVTFARWTQTDARGPVVAHLLTVDLRTPGVRVDYASPRRVRGVATVPDIAARAHAVAAVNGDFYDIGHTGAPLGLGKDARRGLLHGRHQGWNDAFFVDRRGRAGIDELTMTAAVAGRPGLRVTNLNSPFVAPGGIGVYTGRWGRTAGYQVTQGQRKHVRAVSVERGRVVSNRRRLSSDQPIHGLLLVGRAEGADRLRGLAPGARVRVHRALEGDPRTAISGNHFLVRDGLLKPVDDRVLAPRTAVGVDSDTGEVLLLVVDGRSTASRGLTMVELAEMMADLGADDAINLDGGGSSTMVVRDDQGRPAVRNHPSDGFLRRVSNALVVRYAKPAS